MEVGNQPNESTVLLGHYTRVNNFFHFSQLSSAHLFCSVLHCVCRLEQEKSALQKKLKARGVTADQVVGVRSAEMEKEMEELKKKNSDLETQIHTIK